MHRTPGRCAFLRERPRHGRDSARQSVSVDILRHLRTRNPLFVALEGGNGRGRKLMKGNRYPSHLTKRTRRANSEG
jgi:hypothetical protein